jgi:3-isopropylmalate/(R)-2-methylmalate dehydratase small subunit
MSMRKITQLRGLVAPLNRANVDTDAIMPKQYLKSIKRTGFGQYVFDEWRYLQPENLDAPQATRGLNPAFELNEPRYQGATILLTQANFGCGSSREHAPWGLSEYGFQVIIAPSFADIFYNNCLKNAILPIVLPQERVDALFQALYGTPGYQLSIDLAAKTVTTPEKEVLPFDIESSAQKYLLAGLDDIGLTLQHAELIRQFEAKHKKQYPWIFQTLS